MARPTTKQELILLSNNNYQKLFDLINSMPEKKQEMAFLFEDRDRNIRDVLVHLYEWHQLLLNWVNSNLNAETKPFLPEPYNWKTYNVMNVEMIWKNHQNTTYNKAIEMLQNSHNEVMNLLEKFSDEELFIKKHYSWTGTTNLGSYFISATSSHYDWATKKIKKQIKALINK